MLIYVLCGLISQPFLPVTEVCDYTSALWRRDILDISRGIKSKAVSGQKDSPSQDKSGSGDMRFADLFRMRIEGFYEQNRFNEENDRKLIATSKHSKRTTRIQITPPRTAASGAMATSSRLGYSSGDVRWAWGNYHWCKGKKNHPAWATAGSTVAATAVALTIADGASVIGVSAGAAASTASTLLVAASPVSVATFITVLSWSTATSFTTFHDRNVKSPIARRYWS